MNENYSLLRVNLDLNSYPVYLGEYLPLGDILKKYINGQQVLIVTNDIVASLYLPALKKNLENFQCSELVLPDGEQYKNVATLEMIFDKLITDKHRRNTTLIGLGGGVIGDITGFAAACYQRGVNLILLPTTLLGQVDAAIGGKNAVNSPRAKNIIGTFYQPKAVLIDTFFLATLPAREFQSGLAEIIKIALIADEEFFYWLEDNLQSVLDSTPHALSHSIKQAVALKIKFIVEDEKEQNIRALLNLGHTFGHGIEQALGYGTWLHGEAVSVGLVLAAQLSAHQGWLEHEKVQRIKNILTMAKLPITLPSSISIEQLIESMTIDKKKDSAELKFILLKGIGQAVVSPPITEELLKEVLKLHFLNS